MKRKNIQRISVLGVIFTIMIFGASQVLWAQDSKAQTEEEKKQEMLKAAKEQLNGTAWEMELNPTGENKKKPEKDIIRFEGYKIKSDKFTREGFMPTNFTVRMKDTLVVWETMQSKGEGRVFMKGELRGDRMTGALNWQVDNDKIYTYSWSGNQIVVEIEPESAKEEKKEAPKAAVVEEAPKVEAPAEQAAEAVKEPEQAKVEEVEAEQAAEVVKEPEQKKVEEVKAEEPKKKSTKKRRRR